MGYRSNFVDTTCIPVHLVKRFTDQYDIPTFVETGTAGGDSVVSVAHLFKECHTIELFEDRVLQQDRVWPGNVKLHFGSSPDVLPEILAGRPDTGIFFWLDAHYSDPFPNTTNVPECPLLEEIACLRRFQNSVVLIDDARLFLGPVPAPCDPRQWPNLEDIFTALREVFPWHRITVIDDYIIAVSLHFAGALETEWRENYDKRYPSDNERVRTSVKTAFEAFKRYLDGPGT